jgi:DNA mismatch endonuclease, patch repair protein
MAANTREGGRAEVLLRSVLWRRGYRFRKHVRDLPGNPDLVFAAQRVAVFCDGDFWHGRNWPQLRVELSRRSNAAYWVAKIDANRTRDRVRRRALRAQGWSVFECWESDVLAHPEEIATRLALLLAS